MSNGFLMGPGMRKPAMIHGGRCLFWLCSCVVSDTCPVCTPAGMGVLCLTHRTHANSFARAMDAASTLTMDEHEAHLGAC